MCANVQKKTETTAGPHGKFKFTHRKRSESLIPWEKFVIEVSVPGSVGSVVSEDCIRAGKGLNLEKRII